MCACMLYAQVDAVNTEVDTQVSFWVPWNLPLRLSAPRGQ